MRTIVAVVGVALLIGRESCPAAATCMGDCSGDGEVTVDELAQGASLALGIAPTSQCPSFNTNADGKVTIDELIAAVNSAVNSCPTGNLARIVFAEGLPSHISVINVDGSGKTPIHASVGNDTNPVWSPDGTKIAFSTPDANNDHLTIGIMNADGSGYHRIAEDTGLSTPRLPGARTGTRSYSPPAAAMPST